MYIYQEENSWRKNAADSNYPLDTSVMVLDPDQRHIAYTSFTDGVLEYVFYAPGFLASLPLILTSIQYRHRHQL